MTANHVDQWNLPLDRAVRLVGAPGDAIEVALQDLSDDGPAVVRLQVAPSDRRSIVTGQVLAALTDAAIALFPAWLPAASAVTGHSSLDFAAVRIHARRLAASSSHYGPFLSDLAERSMGGSSRRRFSDEEVAEGLAAILGESWGRSCVALVLSSEVASPHRQQAFASASEWLAARGFAVWIVDTEVPAIDRLAVAHVKLPDYLRDVEDSPQPRERSQRLEYRAVAGKPHPGSEVERLVDRELAKHVWAAPRRLNHSFQYNPIAPRYFLDIAWMEDKFVVELDGYEHYSPWQRRKDRLRDEFLESLGYRILRIPNDDVLDNVWKVVGEIDTTLRAQREAITPTAPKEGQHP